MRFSSAVAVALIASVDASSKFTEHDKLAVQGLAKLKQDIAINGYPSETCTLENVAVRREWSQLKKAEKLNYIDAVKCLHSKPALTPAAIASGAKNRYDDFVVTHIQQTFLIHGTASFLPWHRYFSWAYEQLLRNECGYKGYLPYYNWAWWYEDPAKSPLFDGSATSMSDGGAYVAGRNYSCIQSEASCTIKLPPGGGGGCVSGPLANFTMNLGPIASTLKSVKPNPQTDGLGYNPRCISRDLNKVAAYATRDEEITSLINNYTDIYTFQNRMQGDFPNGFLGVHTGGHFTIGGDAGTDLFSSPADPAFFFHHSMIDRVWWIWQNQDLKTRRSQVGGTITLFNSPPSRNGTLQDIMTLGSMLEGAFPNITIGDVQSTLGGPFCYIYA